MRMHVSGSGGSVVQTLLSYTKDFVKMVRATSLPEAQHLKRGHRAWTNNVGKAMAYHSVSLLPRNCFSSNNVVQRVCMLHQKHSFI